MPRSDRREGVAAAAGPRVEATVAALYDRYAARVVRWARRLAGPRFDPEDLLQEIFLVAIRRWGAFRGEAKVTTWLFRITEQVVRHHRRNDALRRLLWGRQGDDLTLGPVGVPTPVEELERREQNLRLYRALDRLPEKYRTVLVLFALEELPGEEIAGLTGLDINTVWVRLHRARVRLADGLAKEMEKGG